MVHIENLRYNNKSALDEYQQFRQRCPCNENQIRNFRSEAGFLPSVTLDKVKFSTILVEKRDFKT